MSDAKQTSIEALRNLELPPRQFMVMGSGILEALGIRPANDIDLVVSNDLYETLGSRGWRRETASNGSDRLAHTGFQVYDTWFDEVEYKSLEELLVDAQWVDGIAYNSLRKLILYKARRGAPKDLIDLKLINSYLES